MKRLLVKGFGTPDHSQEENFLALDWAGRAAFPTYAPGVLRHKAHIAYIGGRGVVGEYSGIETYYEETGKRLVNQITIYCRNHFTPETGVREGVCIWRLPTIRTKHSDTFTLADQHRACEFSDCDVVHYHTLGPALFFADPEDVRQENRRHRAGPRLAAWKWGWVSRQILELGEWASARFPNQTIVVS